MRYLLQIVWILLFLHNKTTFNLIKRENNMRQALILTAALATMSLGAQAVNPYLPLWEYIPDGEPYVFEDPDRPGHYRVYIYGSHDIEVTQYCGRDLVVWSASVDSLDNWRYDGVIFKSTTDRDGNLLYADGSADVLYAPDVATRREADGRTAYYLYPNNMAGGRRNMVAKSYRPDGPFEVCNWSDANPTETVGCMNFDPAAFVDDDGRAYGYWGFERSMAAELDTATMATVKPGAQVIEDLIPGCKQDETYRFFEASSMRKVKDKYILIYSRVSREGEWGLPSTNYTLAYAYSTSPLGPFTYGGTIIDGRGKEPDPRGQGMRVTATFHGNTHGSICQIKDQWYVFYHRQAGTDEFSRQAMVAPITVSVEEGPNGKVTISEAEYTSEGFALEGLDPLRTYAAGIACYYTHPEPQKQNYPSVVYPGSHTQALRFAYDGTSDPYATDINRCPMVNNTSGSVVGYKYFNLNKTHDLKRLTLTLTLIPEGLDADIHVYADRPNDREGIHLGTIRLKATDARQATTHRLDASRLTKLSGKHALFLVFKSKTGGKSICTVETIGFE